MLIKSLTRIKTPVHAKGIMELSLFDPHTGEREPCVRETNHVFLESLQATKIKADSSEPGVIPFMTSRSASGLGGAHMCLLDSDVAVDGTFPYLRGNIIGYGTPSAGSNGLFRGAYNLANQILGEFTSTKSRWKYAYDFTPTQSVGLIKKVGLTRQFLLNEGPITSRHGLLFPASLGPVGATAHTADGTHAYAITSAGVLTKYDVFNRTSVTIDLSGIVGTVAAEYKHVGYAPRTGKYYIYRYSGTAGNRRVFVFSDNTFSSLETSYLASNVAINSTSALYPFYVYGNFMYMSSATLSKIHKADFVNNLAHIVVDLPTTAHPIISGTSWATSQGMLGAPEGIFLISTNYNSGLFSPDSDTIIAYLNGTQMNGTALMFSQLCLPERLVSMYIVNNNYGNALCSIPGAITEHNLAEPFNKPNNKGMTVTYELEVYW